MAKRSALLVAGGLAGAALVLSGCSDNSDTAASDASASPRFVGENAGFCAALLAANDYSAAAEAAKDSGDPQGVKQNAQAMVAALQDAEATLPDDVSKGTKKALEQYSATLRRAMTGDELGDQARQKVKQTTKKIEQYYQDSCRVE